MVYGHHSIFQYGFKWWRKNNQKKRQLFRQIQGGMKSCRSLKNRSYKSVKKLPVSQQKNGKKLTSKIIIIFQLLFLLWDRIHVKCKIKLFKTGKPTNSINNKKSGNIENI